MSEQFDLAAEAKEFADDVSVRALTCLEGAPIPDELKVLGSPDRKRFTFNYRQTIHASPGGPPVGLFGMAYALTADRMGRHLAVHTSKLEVTDVRGKKPILRMEYVRDSFSAPCSHVHVHAESGLFTHLLAMTGHPSPSAVQSIHIPTGGDRFRPCAEDFVQWLIEDCRIAGRDGWRDEVAAGRERWRQIQTAAAVRDRPDVAIAELEKARSQGHG